MLQTSLNKTLWEAILDNDVDKARVALDSGASPNKQRGTKSMLARAFEKEDPKMAILLLQRGANIDSAAHGTTCWDLCVARGWIQAMDLCAQQGVDLDKPTGGNHGFTPAGLAASLGDKEVLGWLKARGADVTVGAPSLELRGKPTLSIWLERMERDERGECDWDTAAWLAEHPHPGVWKGLVGGGLALLEQKQNGMGQKALEILLGVDHWKKDENFLQVSHNTILAAGFIDWARQLRRSIPIPLGAATIDHFGPWTQTPLATSLVATKKEEGRPRRMKKAVQVIHELAEEGACPNALQQGLPLLFFAINQRCPPESVEALLELGANPVFPDLQSEGEEKQDVRLPALLRGGTALHLAAREGNDQLVRTLGKRLPSLIFFKDARGLSPLFRCVLPYVIWSGLNDRNPIAPTLLAFRELGANPLEKTPWGAGILHVLLHANKNFNLHPADMDDAIFFIHDWAAETFEQTRDDGKTGWDVLRDSGLAHEESKAGVLLNQWRMENSLPQPQPGRSLVRRM